MVGGGAGRVVVGRSSGGDARGVSTGAGGFVCGMDSALSFTLIVGLGLVVVVWVGSGGVVVVCSGFGVGRGFSVVVCGLACVVESGFVLTDVSLAESPVRESCLAFGGVCGVGSASTHCSMNCVFLSSIGCAMVGSLISSVRGSLICVFFS